MEIEDQELDADLEFDQAFDELAAGTTPDQLDIAEEESARLRDDQGRFAAVEDETVKQGDDVLDNEPEQLSDLAKYQQENTNWEHRYKSDLGRQSALQSKLAESEKVIQELRSGSLGQEPTDIPSDQWEELKADYPEIAAGIEARFSAQTKGHQSEIEVLRGQISPIQQQAESQYIENQTQSLLSDFPDYRETINTSEFAQWLQVQPHAVQALTASNEAVDASYLLNSFTQSQQSTQVLPESPLRAKRKQQLADSESISGRSSQRKPIDEDDFDAAFNEFAAD